ncbi:unnamed protein product [Boreogadus saida]
MQASLAFANIASKTPELSRSNLVQQRPRSSRGERGLDSTPSFPFPTKPHGVGSHGDHSWDTREKTREMPGIVDELAAPVSLLSGLFVFEEGSPAVLGRLWEVPMEMTAATSWLLIPSEHWEKKEEEEEEEEEVDRAGSCT